MKRSKFVLGMLFSTAVTIHSATSVAAPSPNICSSAFGISVSAKPFSRFLAEIALGPKRANDEPVAGRPTIDIGSGHFIFSAIRDGSYQQSIEASFVRTRSGVVQYGTSTNPQIFAIEVRSKSSISTDAESTRLSFEGIRNTTSGRTLIYAGYVQTELGQQRLEAEVRQTSLRNGLFKNKSLELQLKNVILSPAKSFDLGVTTLDLGKLNSGALTLLRDNRQSQGEFAVFQGTKLVDGKVESLEFLTFDNETFSKNQWARQADVQTKSIAIPDLFLGSEETFGRPVSIELFQLNNQQLQKSLLTEVASGRVSKETVERLNNSNAPSMSSPRMTNKLSLSGPSSVSTALARVYSDDLRLNLLPTEVGYSSRTAAARRTETFALELLGETPEATRVSFKVQSKNQERNGLQPAQWLRGETATLLLRRVGTDTSELRIDLKSDDYLDQVSPTTAGQSVRYRGKIEIGGQTATVSATIPAGDGPVVVTIR